jgi:hypothetical protein
MTKTMRTRTPLLSVLARTVRVMPPLTVLEEQVLAFERGWWRNPGAKEQAITDTFGLSATRYYQLLNDLIGRPEALTADPMLVRRLTRLRQVRRGMRSA